MKKQRRALLKSFEKTAVPLDSQGLRQLNKVTGAPGAYWEYAIKRNKATLATVFFNPQLGYVVRDKWQTNGVGCPKHW